MIHTTRAAIHPAFPTAGETEARERIPQNSRQTIISWFRFELGLTLFFCYTIEDFDLAP